MTSPIIKELELLQSETTSFRRIHRLIDTIEVLCKLYTVASISQLADIIANPKEPNPSPERTTHIKLALCEGLKTPSLGIWWLFAKESAEVLKALNAPHILLGATEALTNPKSLLRKNFEGDNNFISLRNRYAHGATPSDDTCERDFITYDTRLQELLKQSPELTSAKWCVDQDTLRCTLRRDGRTVDLHPLLTYRRARNGEPEGFYFYNRLDDKAAALLNYPEAAHRKDKPAREELLARFPLEQWTRETQQVELNPFREHIERLIETFKGRHEELERLVTHLRERDMGFFVIWGPPGVGKSALLARLAEVLRWDPAMRADAYPQTTWPALELKLVDYYIRRGSSDDASRMLDSVNQRLDAHYNLNLSLGKSPTEKQALLFERLKQIAARLEPHQRLLLIFDGLDEASAELLKLLPRAAPHQIPQRVVVIYGARPQHALKFNFYDTLEREHRDELTLKGLSIPDTRALLSEHVSKYKLSAEYVAAVARESEGNPLYLKLLCQGLAQGTYTLNDITALPKQIQDLYTSLLTRLTKEDPNSAPLLCALAAAKDALTLELMSVALSQTHTMSASQIESGPLSTTYELLTTRHQGRDTTYMLFHESLRDYLREHYSEEIQRHEKHLKEWCRDWRDERGDPKHPAGYARRYAMRFAAPYSLDLIAHYTEQAKTHETLKEEDALLKLIDDETWQRATFESTGNGETMRAAFTAAQEILLRRPTTPSTLAHIARYAVWRHEEPRRFYESQRAALKAPARGKEEEALEQVARRANMGDTPRVRLMLALSAIRALRARDPRIDIPSRLIEIIEEWLEEARDPNLNDLWRLTRA